MAGRPSPLVRPALLAALEAQAEATMPETATVSTRAQAATAGGGVTETTSVITTCAARLRRAGTQPDEIDRGGRYSVEALWVIAVPTSTPLTQSGSVTINGRTFEIVALLGGHSYEPERRVLVVERT